MIIRDYLGFILSVWVHSHYYVLIEKGNLENLQG